MTEQGSEWVQIATAQDLLHTHEEYLTPTDGDSRYKPAAYEPHWSGIIDRPLTFPPDAHSHGWDEIDGKPLSYPPEAHSHTWAEIAETPDAYPPEAHDHDGRYYTEDEIDGALRGKADTSHTHAVTDLDSTNAPSSTTYLRGDGLWATPQMPEVPPQNLYLQSTQPAEPGPWLWLQPLSGGEFGLYYEDGV